MRSQIIRYLEKKPNSTPSQIAATLDRSTTVVSRILANLLQAQLVTFEQNPDDGRVRNYRLASVEKVFNGGEVASPSEVEEQRQYLGLVIAAAVRARRRGNDQAYAIDRLSRVLEQASAAEFNDLALVARRELVTTLRQHGDGVNDILPHLEALSRIATGKTPVEPDLVAPATACLDYELGCRDSLPERDRIEHLTAAATIFRRCRDMDGTHDWAPREGWARLAIAALWRQQTEFGVALDEAELAESIFTVYDDTYGRAEATRIQGFCQRLRGNFADAIAILERALLYAADCSAETCRADVLLQLGDALRCTGAYKRSAEVLNEAVELAEALKRPRTLGFSLTALSAVNFAADDLDQAWKLAARAHPHMASTRPGLALNTRRRAVIARELGTAGDAARSAESVELFHESMQQYVDLQSPAGIAACWVGMGKLAKDVDQPAEAIRGLFEVASSKAGRLLLPIDPWIPSLMSNWADQSHIEDVRRIAEWTYTTERGVESADEMAGEPRLKAALIRV
ncbi:MarR family transcriptional regulator [Mycolicibacterium lacusdiani]|uniref:MarR family transcriptional regulator n=1 Tax=Mycolicibacterium lacusdiani TaxID=2895283 RepID=UPI001EFFB8C4|nr:MarR family transcriptional regulator [Mycolicibacterium lacusdiani]